MKNSFIFLFILLATFLTTSVQAKRYSSSFCEFELPSGWDCVIEGSESICQADAPDRKKEAIIILAAKKRGEQDGLENYQAYLKAPKTYILPGGKTQISEAKYTKNTDISGQIWVDSLHLASEVPGFYTRYLATVKEDIGVAVTFSVTKDLYDQYRAVFDNVAATLKVFRSRDSVEGSKSGLADVGSAENLSDMTFIPEGEKVDISANKTQDRKKGGDDDTTMLLALGAIAVAAFVIIKRKKK